jgi:hypothetical protein
MQHTQQKKLHWYLGFGFLARFADEEADPLAFLLFEGLFFFVAPPFFFGA